jgi:uncharacterized protein (DUF1330 family)
MPAYGIFIKNKTIDAEALKTYSEKAGPASAGHPLSALAYYGPLEVLEGEPAEGVVVLQFPDMAAAKAWYHSPGYQEALQHRLKGGDYRVILTEGL